MNFIEKSYLILFVYSNVDLLVKFYTYYRYHGSRGLEVWDQRDKWKKLMEIYLEDFE